MGSTPVKRATERSLRLWRENRVDQQWTITDADLLERFRKWPGLDGRGRSRAELIEWRGHEWALGIFISDPSGLNSVYEIPEFQTAVGRVWDELRAIDPIGELPSWQAEPNV